MKVGFIGQPFRDWPCGASFITEALADPTVTKLLVLTAWVRESGLAAIAPGLSELRGRGGKVDFFVGVDLKGTSIQGLELADSLATTLKIVHDPEGRTFHPKVYLATGRETNYALVGSNNLTAGGMSYNYEGAVQLTFPPGDAPDLVKGLQLLVRRLNRDTEICKQLTPLVKKRLLADGWLADEVKDRKHRNEDRTQTRKERAGASTPLFGKSRFQKRFQPPPRREGTGTNKGRRKVKGGKGSRAGGRERLPQAPDSWWKQLGPGDAQRPPHGNPTHRVRLTDVPPGVKDRARYFRSVFFGGEEWKRGRDGKGNRIEVAVIKVQASIGSKNLGEKEVEIEYGKFRDVKGRATTLLLWGELIPEVLAQDLTDHYLLIERGQDAYLLSVTVNKPI